MRTSHLLLLLILLLAALAAWLLLDGPRTPEGAAAPEAPESPATVAAPETLPPPPVGGRSAAETWPLRVLDAGGSPVDSARLLLQEEDDAPRWLDAPGGVVDLPRSARRLQAMALAGGRWTRLRILSGEQRMAAASLDLVPADRACSLEVRVWTPDGGAADFSWQLEPSKLSIPGDPDSMLRARFWSRASGSGTAGGGLVLIEDLPPATWSLRIVSAGGPPVLRTVKLDAGAHERLELLLETGGWVEGLVGRDDGSRLAGATVLLLPVEQGVMEGLLDELRGPRLSMLLEDMAVPGGRARSGKEGRYRIGPVAPGEYRLYGTAPGLLPARLEEPVTVRPGDTTQARALVLPSGSALVVAVRRAEDGEPLAGASVRYHLGDRAESPWSGVFGWEETDDGVSDAEGRVLLSGLPAGRLTLQVRADGRGSAERAVTLAASEEPATVVVELEPALKIRGRVLDLATRGPVEGARILPRPAGDENFMEAFLPPRRDEAHEARSGPDGSFVVDGLAAGRWKLLARAEDRAPALTEAVVLVPGRSAPVQEILLGRGARLRVRVLGENGEPEPGRVVTVFSLGRSMPDAGRTDERGEVVFEHLAPGSYTVAALRGEAMEAPASMLQGDFAGLQMDSESVTLAEGEEAELTLGGPQQRSQVYGFVTQGGAPVGNLTVLLSQGMQFQMGRTDGAGFYEFEDVRPGDYVFMAGQIQMGGGSGYTESLHVPPATEVQHDVELPGTHLRVRVLAESDGAPLSGIPVILRPRTSNQGGGMLTTDAHGEVQFQYLSPGDFILVAGKAAMPFFGAGGDRAAAVVDPVELVEGIGEQVIELRLGKGATLEATILGPDGEPVAGASVFLLTRSGQPVTMLSMKTSRSDGLVTLRGLPVGPHRALARHPRLGTIEAPVDLHAGETTAVTLRLESGALLRIIPVGPDGEVLRGVQAIALDSRGAPISVLMAGSEAMERGLAFLEGKPQELGPLAPGHYEILLTTMGGKPSRYPVDVPAGGGEMELRLVHDP